MSNDDPVSLVRVAILSGVTGCFEFKNDKTAEITQRNFSDIGLTPRQLKRLVVEYVYGGGAIDLKKEIRPEYRDYECWFRVRIPWPGEWRKVFVEMVLEDPDPDFPSVLIVNAHWNTE